MENNEKLPLNDENNKIAAENHQRKKLNYEKFFQNFEKEYKLIKVKMTLLISISPQRTHFL